MLDRRSRLVAPAFVAWPGIPDRDLLATILHVITETAAHVGHLDIVRELTDERQLSGAHAVPRGPR